MGLGLHLVLSMPGVHQKLQLQAQQVSAQSNNYQHVRICGHSLRPFLLFHVAPIGLQVCPPRAYLLQVAPTVHAPKPHVSLAVSFGGYADYPYATLKDIPHSQSKY